MTEEAQDAAGRKAEGGEEDVISRKVKAKSSSLIAQIVAALWIAGWSAKMFITGGGGINDIIFSGFAIAACFVPVYFSLILDKVRDIKFGG